VGTGSFLFFKIHTSGTLIGAPFFFKKFHTGLEYYYRMFLKTFYLPGPCIEYQGPWLMLGGYEASI